MKKIKQASHAFVELVIPGTSKIYEVQLSVMIDVDGNAKARLANLRNETLGECVVMKNKDT